MANILSISKRRVLPFNMRTAFAIFVTLLLVSCGGKVGDVVHSVELIAHAGGNAGGHVYTNSREALEQSLQNGYRYIEFDLVFTADSVLVAAHDWQLFNEQTGFAHKKDTAPTYTDFSSRRIMGRYTPLSAAEINEVFEGDTTLYLVTDKISSPTLLARNFPHLKQRMVVEAFNYSDYKRLCTDGYYRVLYSCQATDLGESLVKHILLHRLFAGPQIEWITMYAGALDNIAFRTIDALAQFNIALFTINDPAELPLDKFNDINKVKMIYTDYINPAESGK